MSTALIKIGGSLLDLPDLAGRIRSLADRSGCERHLLLVGGGRAADVVRQWDQVHSLSAEHGHWLAVDAMSLTARLVEILMPEVQVVTNRAAATECFNNGRVPCLAPRSILESFSAEVGADVPHDWESTSDSIAAWFAIRWPVDRLILAKSIEIPSHRHTGHDDKVDSRFREFVSDCPPLFWCDLRNSPETLKRWLPDADGSLLTESHLSSARDDIEA